MGHRLPSWVSLLCRADVWFKLCVTTDRHPLEFSTLASEPVSAMSKHKIAGEHLNALKQPLGTKWLRRHWATASELGVVAFLCFS